MKSVYAARKKAMTSIDVASIVAELSNLEGDRIVNIYDAATPNAILVRVKGKHDKWILAEPGKRLHVTVYPYRREQMPSPFTMALRKYLKGQRIVNVKQLGFDRIVVLEVGNGCQLVVELMPRGVIALLAPDGRILQASEYRVMRDRVIRRGEPYRPPPSTSTHPLSLTLEALEKVVEECRKDEESMVACMVKRLGYPGELVEEALERFNAYNIEELLKGIRIIYEEALEPGGYLVYGGNGAPWGVVPFLPLRALKLGLKVRRCEPYSSCLDEYFTLVMREEAAAEKAKAILEHIEKLKRSLKKAEESLRELIERKRRLEELLILLGENYQEVSQALDCVKKYANIGYLEHSLGSCRNVIDVKNRVVTILVRDRRVDVQPPYDLDQLILSYSRRVRELEAKISRTLKAIEELKRKIKEMSVEAQVSTKAAKAMIRRREWYEKFHWMYTSQWRLVIGGRNADQNESIVRKYMSDKDIFMHAEVHGAPVVVILCKGVEPSLDELKEAAVIAACYSKAWKHKVGAIDVYWVWGYQVSKSPPPGQYLSKGSFMVYGRRNYIRGVELKIAIGVGVEENSPLIVVGPPNLVERRTIVYSVVAPGDMSVDEAAKTLKKKWLKTLGDEYKWLIDPLHVNEIKERLPGSLVIVETKRGKNIEPPRPPRGEET